MVKKKTDKEDETKGGKVGDSHDNMKHRGMGSDRKASTHHQSDKEGQVSSEDEIAAGAVTESPAGVEMMEKLAEMQDRYLRLSAEFDNYRKRTLKEKIELTRTASESVLIKLLPVIDDFERGLKVMESASDCNAMKEGMNLIYSKFKAFLDQNGIKEIDAMNKPFNVDLHEAVTNIPAPEEKMKGTVIDVVEKGYLLTDKVIRFSKVVVGE
jgi:molecular chaperone GrpE